MPHLMNVNSTGIQNVASRLQLSSFTTFTSNNRVVISGYERNVIIVCIYKISPITADTMPNIVKIPLLRASILFRPHHL